MEELVQPEFSQEILVDELKPSPNEKEQNNSLYMEQKVEKENESENMSISDDGVIRPDMRSKAEGPRKTMTFLGTSYLSVNNMDKARVTQSAYKVNKLNTEVEEIKEEVRVLRTEEKETDFSSGRMQAQKDFSHLLLTNNNRKERLSDARKSFH